MYSFQLRKYNSFSLPLGFDEKILLRLFYKMHFMSGLGKEAQS